MLGKETGFVEHLGGLYEKMTVKQYLQFFAGLSGTEKRLNSAIEQMHLSGLMKKRLSKCTDGEKKRVRIAREITKGAENYFILNPIAFEDENSKKIILGWMETIGSVKNFVALVKNGSFLVRITDMTILIEKEFIYGSSKRPNSTDYNRKQHYQCG